MFRGSGALEDAVEECDANAELRRRHIHTRVCEYGALRAAIFPVARRLAVFRPASRLVLASRWVGVATGLAMRRTRGRSRGGMIVWPTVKHVDPRRRA